MVHKVFTGRGHGIAQILNRRLPRRVVKKWLRENSVHAGALPRDLSATQWVTLFETARSWSSSSA
jgi:23S rRNA (adenine-N6)-dimethyltransferase